MFRRRKLQSLAALAVIALILPAVADDPVLQQAQVGPKFQSAGPLAFGPATGGTAASRPTGRVLFAADNQAATIFAIDLGEQAAGGEPGTANVSGIGAKIAAMLGTESREIAIVDMAVHPVTKNAYLSVTRGTGSAAVTVIMRVDGAGKITLVSLEGARYTSVTLPNPPSAASGGRQRSSRGDTVTDMAYVDGKLFIAGLSNEEFASKLRSVAYPFVEADNGTSVEIFHGAHGAWETRSPIYTFVPYDINDESHLIAGYLCTPLVKFPIGDLKPGAKVVGTTIAELGNRNRPIDMIVYKKDGKDYLLMSNTSRGVMKIPTADFGDQDAITNRISGTAGIAYETISQLQGVVQLDLLDESRALIIAQSEDGALNLTVIDLP